MQDYPDESSAVEAKMRGQVLCGTLVREAAGQLSCARRTSVEEGARLTACQALLAPLHVARLRLDKPVDLGKIALSLTTVALATGLNVPG